MYSQFSKNEVRDIILAWVIVSIAISFSGLLAMQFGYVVAAFVAAGTGFVFHEMGHKFMAIRYGYVAHFRLWILGILLLLFTGVAAGLSGTGILFGAPGATYIGAAVAGSYGLGYYSSNHKARDIEKESMLISAAGPATNLAFAALFYSLSYITSNTPSSFLYLVGELGFYLNLGLGSFNMIPFPPLDGYKIFRTNILVGMALALPLWITLIYLYLF